MNSVAVIKTIDREKVTPFLLRCFWKANKSRTEFEYKDAAKQILPADEAQIYTWPDATLRELSDVLSAAIPEARRSNIVFSLVYPDRNGVFTIRQIGQTSFKGASPDDGRTLASADFQIGDFLDITIYPPKFGGIGRGSENNAQIRLH